MCESFEPELFVSLSYFMKIFVFIFIDADEKKKKKSFYNNKFQQMVKEFRVSVCVGLSSLSRLSSFRHFDMRRAQETFAISWAQQVWIGKKKNHFQNETYLMHTHTCEVEECLGCMGFFAKKKKKIEKQKIRLTCFGLNNLLPINILFKYQILLHLRLFAAF